MSAYSITLPHMGQNGILFNSPHSGTRLPERFLKQVSIDPSRLLYSSDLMVDRLVQNVPLFGTTVFINHFARIYVDTNRSAREIDPGMFENLTRANDFDNSSKVSCGFGIFSRRCYNGQEIYAEKLPESEIDRRLNAVYYPVHRALATLLNSLHHQHGFYLLLDCHSMPSHQFIHPGQPHSHQPDLIIGTCFGTSCRKAIVQYIAGYFTGHGLKVAYDNPYAGGFNTQTYGDPQRGRHALQLEFNRALYMNEKTLEPHEGFSSLQTLVTGLAENLTENLAENLAENRAKNLAENPAKNPVRDLRRFFTTK